jgi:hypothetical protein
MGNRDYLLTKIRNAKDLAAGQEDAMREAKTPADRTSAQMELNRQRAYINHYRHEWQGSNPGKKCPE